MHIQELLKLMIDSGASDMHVKTARPPLLRVRGDLAPVEMEALTAELVKELVFQVLTEKQREQFGVQNEFDCAYNWEGVARFRASIFRERGNLTMVIRVIPAVIPTLDELDVPDIFRTIASSSGRGLVLVTGATGSGKSTTLAAMINELNENEAEHIVTVEDPIEFVHPDKKCSVCQREVGLDTETFASALRYVLRQDPDTILIGEMRDAETVRAAISAAETGHLVFSTLHTMDATQTIDRIVDFFSSDQQQQIRVQLSNSLKAVISQRLVKRADGTGRIPAAEVMICTPTVSSYITENKLSAIRTLIKDGSNEGMQTFDQSLVALIKSGKITKEEGMETASSPHELELALKGITSSKGSAQNILNSMHAAQNKEEVAALMNQGINFMKRERLEEASAAFKKVLQIDTSHREAKHYLETLEARVGNEMMSDEAKIYVRKGLEYYQEDKIQEAVQEWEQALDIDPNNAQAQAYIKGAKERVDSLKGAREMIDLGVEAYQAGDLKTAITTWEEALKVDPHNEQAEHYLVEGRKQQDRLTMENEAKELFVAGASALQAGEAFKAGGSFAMALRINPEYTEAREYLEEARKTVQEAGLAGLDSASPDASSILQPWQRGVDAFLTADFRQARIEFNTAKQKRPTMPSLGEFLEIARVAHNAECDRLNTKGREAYDGGNLIKAVEIWKTALSENPKSEVLKQSWDSVQATIKQKTEEWYKQGVEAARNGQHKEAMAALEQVLQLEPDNDNAKKRLLEAKEKISKMNNIMTNVQN